MKDDAWGEGYKAAKQDEYEVTRTTNPYKPGTDIYRYWQNGYKAGEEDLRGGYYHESAQDRLAMFEAVFTECDGGACTGSGDGGCTCASDFSGQVPENMGAVVGPGKKDIKFSDVFKEEFDWVKYERENNKPEFLKHQYQIEFKRGENDFRDSTPWAFYYVKGGNIPESVIDPYNELDKNLSAICVSNEDPKLDINRYEGEATYAPYGSTSVLYDDGSEIDIDYDSSNNKVEFCWDDCSSLLTKEQFKKLNNLTDEQLEIIIEAALDDFDENLRDPSNY